VGFLLSLALPERPLRATLSAETADSAGKVGEAFAMPVTPDSLAELRRGLAALANRDAQRQYIQRIIDEANVDLSPVAAWLLVRLEAQPGVDPATLSAAHSIDPAHISRAIDELTTRRLVATDGDRHRWRLGVTPEGCEMLGRIVRVRRAHLARAAAEFGTNGENAATLRGIERELVPDARPTTGEHAARTQDASPR
jgi:DNA-binding MarR family transcriptional regulator